MEAVVHPHHHYLSSQLAYRAAAKLLHPCLSLASLWTVSQLWVMEAVVVNVKSTVFITWVSFFVFSTVVAMVFTLLLLVPQFWVLLQKHSSRWCSQPLFPLLITSIVFTFFTIGQLGTLHDQPKAKSLTLLAISQLMTVVMTYFKVPAGSPSHGGDVMVYVWHKPTKLAHSFLFCSCVCFCLYGLFNCISFHKFSWQLSIFWLLPVLFLPYWSFQLYITLWKSPSALI